MVHDKKTIAIICDRNPHTSFGRMTLDLHKVLSEEFNVCVIWLKTPKYFPDDLELPEGGHAISAPSLELGWWLFRFPLRRLLREIKPDKTLLIHQGIGYLVREIRRTIPSAWTGVIVHDVFPKTLYPRSIKYRLFYRYFIAPARFADGFLYNSEYTRTQAHSVMGLAADHPVIGCPIDTSVFRPRKDEMLLLRQKWGVDKYNGVCLNISLDEPRKNIGTFFALAKQRPQTAFVRVGPFSPWMKKWIDENSVNNIIHFSGIPPEQLIELYTCADLFIYPSLAEGFGIPPLEALACGVPAVAASTSALKENLNGIAPLIDPPDNIEEYLEIIDDVLAGKNVVEWKAAGELLERFSMDNFGERVCACLRP